MGKALFAACAFVAVTLAPGSAFAWGTGAHRMIMRRAIELLPTELKPFFEQFKDEVVLRVTDPDLWRSVGWEEDPHREQSGQRRLQLGATNPEAGRHHADPA